MFDNFKYFKKKKDKKEMSELDLILKRKDDLIKEQEFYQLKLAFWQSMLKGIKFAVLILIIISIFILLRSL